MFYEKLKLLCDINGTSVTALTVQLGLSKGSVTNWKNGVIPNGEAIILFAKHFGVSTDYFLMDDMGDDEVSNFINNVSSKQLLNLFHSMSADEQKIVMDNVIQTFLREEQKDK